MEEETQQPELAEQPPLKNVAILDKNHMVVGVMTWPVDVPKQKILDEYYSNLYYVLEYDFPGGKTVNDAGISTFYDAELNGFVSRKPLDQPTYVFNPSTLCWEPDPNLLYDIDGTVAARWDAELTEFVPVDTQED